MNKRIVELHNQTMYWVADNGGLRISDRIPTGYTEKFAELIVRECAKKGFDVFDEEPDAPASDLQFYVRDGIKEHFGVEE